jgi:segregation and condensation protein A
VIEADEQFDLPVRAAPETSTLILQLGSWEGPLDFHPGAG